MGFLPPFLHLWLLTPVSVLPALIPGEGHLGPTEWTLSDLSICRSHPYMTAMTNEQAFAEVTSTPAKSLCVRTDPQIVALLLQEDHQGRLGHHSQMLESSIRYVLIYPFGEKCLAEVNWVIRRCVRLLPHSDFGPDPDLCSRLVTTAFVGLLLNLICAPSSGRKTLMTTTGVC